MPRAQQLGRYQLLDRIAFGGMAEIFRAKTFDDEGRAHLVAIKRVLGHLVEDDEFLQMIVDEAKISALLRHDNIAQVYEFARAGSEYFLAMEYVDGKDLRAVMERVRALGQPIAWEHAAWVGMEVAEALHAAHTQRDGGGQLLRIVHRDVSPSNVLCSYRGEVKLCDFGIAKATLTRIQTRAGVIKGKVRYMSPEQAMGRKLDHRSDLFSLGTVLYELLALQPPFSAPSEVDLIFTVREARRRPITDHRPDTPPPLRSIIDRAMTRNRAARYDSGAQLASDLRAFLRAQRPGYGRGHFAQFMRDIFRQDIEHELRRLEEYVLDEADVSQVGENLIADVLAKDAPFTRFLPSAPGHSATTDVSGLPPSRPPRPGGADFHDERTLLLGGGEQTLVLSPAGPPAARASSFHDETTADRGAAAGAPATPVRFGPEGPDTPAAPASLPRQRTVVQALDPAELARLRQEPAPAPPAASFADEPSVPLDDDDLMEVSESEAPAGPGQPPEGGPGKGGRATPD